MELLVVVAILLILVGVSVPTYMWYVENSKERTVKAAVKMYASEVRNFLVTLEGDPAAQQDAQQRFTSGMWPPTVNNGNPPVNPWGEPYVITWGPNGPIVSTKTPKGMVSSEEGGAPGAP